MGILNFGIAKLQFVQAAKEGFAVAFSTLPIDTPPIDVIIEDGTQLAQAFIHIKSQTTMDSSTGLDPDLLSEHVIKKHDARMRTIFQRTDMMRLTRQLRFMIVLFDNPQHVPVAKSIEHSKRGYTAYTKQDLIGLDILVHDAPDGNPDSRDEPSLNADFGASRIWGKRSRLWANRITRQRINEFFLHGHLHALQHFTNLACQPRFILDPPNQDDVLFTGQVGASTMPVQRIVLQKMTGGEADIKCLHYLDRQFGSCFLVRSDDGDWLINLVAALERLEHFHNDNNNQSSSTPLELPTIWIDRTVNYTINDTVDGEARYINVTRYYQWCKMRSDKTSRTVLPTLAMMMFSGNDYVPAFCKMGGFARSPLIYGPGKLLKTVFNTLEYDRLFTVERRCVLNYQGRREWALVPSIDEAGLLTYLLARYKSGDEDDTNDKTPALPADLSSCLTLNIRRLYYALLYAYAVPHSLPLALQCIECVNGQSRWGWEFAPVVTEQSNMLAFSLPSKEGLVRNSVLNAHHQSSSSSSLFKVVHASAIVAFGRFHL